jgi:hypothetical protein
MKIRSLAAAVAPMTSAPARIALGMMTLASICSPLVDARQAGVRPQASRITIPFLANATKPADLGFEGGGCDIDKTGKTMECQFQQVILTTSEVVPQTCLITTNRYERIFQRETSTRWVSREGPAGPCGVVDVFALQDDGGVRWTMAMQKMVTRKDASPQCLEIDEQPETLSWQNIRRALPCRFIQPGGLAGTR